MTADVTSVSQNLITFLPEEQLTEPEPVVLRLQELPPDFLILPQDKRLKAERLKNVFIKKDFLDESGTLTDKGREIKLPPLNREERKNIRFILTEIHTLDISGNMYNLGDAFSYLRQNSELPCKSIDLAGGEVFYRLSPTFFYRFLHNARISGWYSPNEKLSYKMQETPNDMDIKYILPRVLEADLKKISGMYTDYISCDCQCELTKKKYIYDSGTNTHYMIIATKDDKNTELSFVEHLGRDCLFTCNSLYIPLLPLFQKYSRPEIYSYENCPQKAIIHLLCMIIDIENPDTCNHMLFPNYISYLTRGFVCLKPELEVIFVENFKKYYFNSNQIFFQEISLALESVRNNHFKDTVSLLFLSYNFLFILQKHLSESEFTYIRIKIIRLLLRDSTYYKDHSFISTFYSLMTDPEIPFEAVALFLALMTEVSIKYKNNLLELNTRTHCKKPLWFIEINEINKNYSFLITPDIFCSQEYFQSGLPEKFHSIVNSLTGLEKNYFFSILENPTKVPTENSPEGLYNLLISYLTGDSEFSYLSILEQLHMLLERSDTEDLSILFLADIAELLFLVPESDGVRENLLNIAFQIYELRFQKKIDSFPPGLFHTVKEINKDLFLHEWSLILLQSGEEKLAIKAAEIFNRLPKKSYEEFTKIALKKYPELIFKIFDEDLYPDRSPISEKLDCISLLLNRYLESKQIDTFSEKMFAFLQVFFQNNFNADCISVLEPTGLFIRQFGHVDKKPHFSELLNTLVEYTKHKQSKVPPETYEKLTFLFFRSGILFKDPAAHKIWSNNTNIFKKQPIDKYTSALFYRYLIFCEETKYNCNKNDLFFLINPNFLKQNSKKKFNEILENYLKKFIDGKINSNLIRFLDRYPHEIISTIPGFFFETVRFTGQITKKKFHPEEEHVRIFEGFLKYNSLEVHPYLKTCGSIIVKSLLTEFSEKKLWPLKALLNLITNKNLLPLFEQKKVFFFKNSIAILEKAKNYSSPNILTAIEKFAGYLQEYLFKKFNKKNPLHIDALASVISFILHCINNKITFCPKTLSGLEKNKTLLITHGLNHHINSSPIDILKIIENFFPEESYDEDKKEVITFLESEFINRHSPEITSILLNPIEKILQKKPEPEFLDKLYKILIIFTEKVLSGKNSEQADNFFKAVSLLQSHFAIQEKQIIQWANFFCSHDQPDLCRALLPYINPENEQLSKTHYELISLYIQRNDYQTGVAIYFSAFQKLENHQSKDLYTKFLTYFFQQPDNPESNQTLFTLLKMQPNVEYLSYWKDFLSLNAKDSAHTLTFRIWDFIKNEPFPLNEFNKRIHPIFLSKNLTLYIAKLLPKEILDYLYREGVFYKNTQPSSLSLYIINTGEVLNYILNSTSTSSSSEKITIFNMMLNLRLLIQEIINANENTELREQQANLENFDPKLIFKGEKIRSVQLYERLLLHLEQLLISIDPTQIELLYNVFHSFIDKYKHLTPHEIRVIRLSFSRVIRKYMDFAPEKIDPLYLLFNLSKLKIFPDLEHTVILHLLNNEQTGSQERSNLKFGNKQSSANSDFPAFVRKIPDHFFQTYFKKVFLQLLEEKKFGGIQFIQLIKIKNMIGEETFNDLNLAFIKYAQKNNYLVQSFERVETCNHVSKCLLFLKETKFFKKESLMHLICLYVFLQKNNGNPDDAEPIKNYFFYLRKQLGANTRPQKQIADIEKSDPDNNFSSLIKINVNFGDSPKAKKELNFYLNQVVVFMKCLYTNVDSLEEYRITLLFNCLKDFLTYHPNYDSKKFSDVIFIFFSYGSVCSNPELYKKYKEYAKELYEKQLIAQTKNHFNEILMELLIPIKGKYFSTDNDIALKFFKQKFIILKNYNYNSVKFEKLTLLNFHAELLFNKDSEYFFYLFETILKTFNEESYFNDQNEFVYDVLSKILFNIVNKINKPPYTTLKSLQNIFFIKCKDCYIEFLFHIMNNLIFQYKTNENSGTSSDIILGPEKKNNSTD